MMPLNLGFIKRPLYKERFLFAVLFAAMGFFYYQWFYAPLAKEAGLVRAGNDGLRREAATYRALVSEKKKEADKLQEITTTYEGMKEKLMSLKEKYPPTGEITAIDKDIPSCRPGISLISVQPQAVEDKVDYQRHPLSLQMRGNFLCFGKFLSRLEDSSRLIGIENITIIKDEQPRLMIKLDMSEYIMPKDFYER